MTKENLHKIETFVKVALNEISHLQSSLNALNEKKAAEMIQSNELDQALKKAAEAMYSADFIIDEEGKKAFMKKAKEDAKYLAKVVERVCNASDVAYMGKVASVTSSNYTDDPVLRRAFGYDGNYNLLDI